MRIPRILLCAGASGSGKTLITCGILQAMINMGLKPASFKCGPDYIDPMFHTRVLGTKSRNLDTFFAGKTGVKHILAENCKDADIAVIEGVMGYYDGIAGTTTAASTYEVASETDTPAVLVVNAKGMSLSAAAYVNGFKNFRSDSNIKGVILNRISPMIYPRLKTVIEAECGVSVLGYVPQVDDCVIESRHLGLIMPDEIGCLREKLIKLADILQKTIDWDKLLNIAENAPDIDENENLPEIEKGEQVKIAVAKDEAFCFMYEDNIEILKRMGAQIEEFSPIHDKKLPENAAGLILYGGYPELYGKELSVNTSMLEDIRESYDKGMPLMAECGGFMYLHETMEDAHGNPCSCVGIIKGRAYKTDKLGRFGYINLTGVNDSFIHESEAASATDEQNEIFPAHEFHYYDSTEPGDCFNAQKPCSDIQWSCIHSKKNMLAGFPHFYYYGNLKLPEAFLKKCRKYKNSSTER